MIDKVFISWIGPTSLGVELNDVVKGFSLEEGQVVPPEFKVGDLVELHLESDPAAEIWGIDNSKGCYLFKHIDSGKSLELGIGQTDINLSPCLNHRMNLRSDRSEALQGCANLGSAVQHRTECPTILFSRLPGVAPKTPTHNLTHNLLHHRSSHSQRGQIFSLRRQRFIAVIDT